MIQPSPFAAVRVFIAIDDIPELDARRGELVLDDGGPRLAVLHEGERRQLTAAPCAASWVARSPSGGAY